MRNKIILGGLSVAILSSIGAVQCNDSPAKEQIFPRAPYSRKTFQEIQPLENRLNFERKEIYIEQKEDESIKEPDTFSEATFQEINYCFESFNKPIDIERISGLILKLLENKDVSNILLRVNNPDENKDSLSLVDRVAGDYRFLREGLELSNEKFTYDFSIDRIFLKDQAPIKSRLSESYSFSIGVLENSPKKFSFSDNINCCSFSIGFYKGQNGVIDVSVQPELEMIKNQLSKSELDLFNNMNLFGTRVVRINNQRVIIGDFSSTYPIFPRNMDTSDYEDIFPGEMVSNLEYFGHIGQSLMEFKTENNQPLPNTLELINVLYYSQ